ncbi:MAG: hypothetical protein PHW13_14070 [Methylococcales bacterium]|nr:hypothetical protein [Methylococcales bacterium]
MNKWLIAIIALAAGLALGYPTGALLTRRQRDAAEKIAAKLRYELEMTTRNIADQQQAGRRQAEQDAAKIETLTQQAQQAAARIGMLEQELQKRPVAVEQYTAQLKEWSGTGDFDTPAFEVKGPWMVQCTMTEGAADELLLIGVHRKRGAVRLVDTLSLNGPGQTSTVIYDSGRYYLAITGGGQWRVQILGREYKPNTITEGEKP